MVSARIRIAASIKVIVTSTLIAFAATPSLAEVVHCEVTSASRDLQPHIGSDIRIEYDSDRMLARVND